MVLLYDQRIAGSQSPEDLFIYNEVTCAKRPKRQRPPSTSSSEFHDLIENLNERFKNQKRKDDNAAFKQDMLNRLGLSPCCSVTFKILHKSDN
ncbi:hypothetical protein MKW94_013933 [Papaver nudicaule]|uniref:Uncharacterized protein n=1 Tax=Papaver nudicaule TaxID=74823 RepID=A0AA41UYM9_PAPNU|nr:hypothetical protein [Papaver nudicaule]